MAYTGNIQSYSPSYYDVMEYIHSAPISFEEKKKIGLRLIEETIDPALLQAYNTIEEMSQLKQGWAGDGTLAVSPRVLSNIKNVILISNNADWEEWMIGPDVNATIGLQSKTNRALMSLGAKEFSYFVRKNGERLAASHVDFDPQVFLNTMRKIA